MREEYRSHGQSRWERQRRGYGWERVSARRLQPSPTFRHVTATLGASMLYLMGDEPRRRYVRRPDRPVAAVRLALDTAGLIYRKWGGEQRAKPGDWIVDNDGDVYTVDADVFART